MQNSGIINNRSDYLMKLADINEKTPLIKKFIARLQKVAKQSVPIVEVERTKRISGASAKPVHLALEGGQVLKLYIRIVDDHPDLFRIDLNDKNMPLAGDYDIGYMPAFNASVDLIANTVRSGQKQFEKKLAAATKKDNNKPPIRRNAPKNKAQQLQHLKDELSELDKSIAEKQATKAKLEQELEAISSGDTHG